MRISKGWHLMNRAIWRVELVGAQPDLTDAEWSDLRGRALVAGVRLDLDDGCRMRAVFAISALELREALERALQRWEDLTLLFGLPFVSPSRLVVDEVGHPDGVVAMQQDRPRPLVGMATSY